MKFVMLDFLLGLEFNPINPYYHLGSPETNPFHRNVHGIHYRMYPELTRPTRTGGMSNFYYSGYAPAVAGLAGLVVPAYLMATATASYPEVAGPQYQSAMTGQMSINVDLNTLTSMEFKDLNPFRY